MNMQLLFMRCVADRDLFEFCVTRSFLQHAVVFDAEELRTLQTNLALMRDDIRAQYQLALDQSHHGHPTIVETIYTGQRGRPRIYIDPDFLRWAYNHRSTSGIARFLHVDHSVVRNALLEYGIAQPQADPFARDSPEPESTTAADEQDELLDPDLPAPRTIPADVRNATLSSSEGTTYTTSYTGPLSAISDNDLDILITRLRVHYRRAGISMLDGMLRRLHHHVPRERIRLSLLRIDPVQRVFQRIRIRRRVYSVPGPNSLWHHDGQHGM